MSNKPIKSALIVGGGIGGCTLAYFLAEHGIRVKVVEKAEHFSDKGFALVIGASGGEVLRRMHLEHTFEGKDISVPVTNVFDNHRRLVRTYAHKHREKGEFPITLHWADFHGVLFGMAKECAEFCLGTTVTDYIETKEEVITKFSDGHEESFDIIVAADGIHSSIRKRLFGVSGERSLGAAFFAFLIPDRLEPHYPTGNIGLMAAGKYASVGVYASGAGRKVGGYFMYRGKRTYGSRLAAEHKAALDEKFSGQHPFYRDVIDSLADDDYVVHDELMQIELPKWSHGRVVLLGDAAHALTLVSGLGASMAMVGAYILVEELARRNGTEEAFMRYEERLRPQVERVQMAVRRKLKNLMPENAFRRMAVMGALRYMPEALFQRMLMHSIPDVISF